MAKQSGPSYVYVGAAHSTAGTRGGIFRRPASGGPWEQLAKGLPDDAHVQAITVDPGNPDVVYLGTHDEWEHYVDLRSRIEGLFATLAAVPLKFGGVAFQKRSVANGSLFGASESSRVLLAQ